ncbi:MAG: T9SS type A sorting domain-containing protein [Bacteroidota bacterium]|nr:T9SS type A sorting domain-containing protein [Bacteroidota bacterium]
MKSNLQFVSLALLLFSMAADGQQSEFFNKSNPPLPLSKISGSPSYQILNINNITTWQRADGQSNHTPLGENGCIFPRGTASVIYQDGILWGAKAYLDSAYTMPDSNQVVRVGGTTYFSGTRAGRIIGWDTNAVRANENDADVRVYRIRRDYAELGRNPDNWELLKDASEYFEIPIGIVSQSQILQILSWYARDWREWPVQYGAPYIERNGIAGYQPPPPFSVDFTHHNLISGNYDEPGIAGSDPSATADQVIWTVYNDLDRTATIGLFGTEPLGLEIQVTLWGYKSTHQINNAYFKRAKIINKGGVDIGGGQKGSFWIDSLFIGIWSDIDIGDFADDLIGCDTLRQSAFCYNNTSIDAEFKRFNLIPPAVGYALLYGPLVAGSPTDKGVFNFRSINGKRNLGITSFSPKYTGSSFGDPPFSYEGALRWWKWLRGYLPEPSTNPDRLYPHPPGMLPTKFPFSGDPINRTGFIDGLGTLYSAPAGDRILTLNTGPVKLAPGDSTEIVYAVIGGHAYDHLASLSLLRHYIDIARHLAKIKFALPRPPESPKVRVIELDREIILEWGSDLASVQRIEKQIIAGEYGFEGYNIYQLPSANSKKSDATRIATYDLKNNVGWITDKFIDPTFYYIREEVVQRGENTRIKRYISFKQDVLDKNHRLNNGQEYYFAVTAYNYSPSPDAIPKTMESEMIILKAKPQIPFGVGLQTKHYDKLPVKHIQGQSEGSISPYVIDPTSGTGDTYEIRFDTINGGVKWSLYNLNSNRQIIADQFVEPDADPPIVEGGILLKINYMDVDTMVLSRYHWLDDIYQYTVPAIDSSLAQKKASSRMVNVFPNPYYAGHSHTTSSYREFVTFNNLPPRAVIRIFNLAGHLVQTIHKSDASQFVEWNLRTEESLQVASGIYLCYVEMPEIGETKVLKLAIIQPEILER